MKLFPSSAKALAIYKVILIFMVIFMALTIGIKSLYPKMFELYTGVVNAPLSYDNSRRLSVSEFEGLARELTYQARYR